MNPILLKPASDRNSQVIINGKVFKNIDAVEYFAFRPQLKQEIKDIYNELLSGILKLQLILI
jgi:adenosylcobyric acid synthase